MLITEKNNEFNTSITDSRLASDGSLKSWSKVHHTAILPTATWCSWNKEKDTTFSRILVAS